MRHFWNPKLKEVRKTLPAEVIMFLESEYEDPGAEHHVRERTTQDLVTLIGRRYIKLIEQGGQIALDVDGIEWLAREYPRVVRWWQKALERTPTAAQILVGGIGFLSAGWDVIQLTLWLATRK
jgi:hypothetical protein